MADGWDVELVTRSEQCSVLYAVCCAVTAAYSLVGDYCPSWQATLCKQLEQKRKQKTGRVAGKHNVEHVRPVQNAHRMICQA